MGGGHGHLILLIYKRGLAGRANHTEMPRAQVECSNIILQHLGEWGELDTVGAKDLKGGGQVDHATAPCSGWAADRLTPWLCLFTTCSAGPHRYACVPGYNSYKLRDGKCSPGGAVPGRLPLEGSLFSGRLHGDGEGSPTLSLCQDMVGASALVISVLFGNCSASPARLWALLYLPFRVSSRMPGRRGRTIAGG